MIINFIYFLLSSFVFFWFYINIKKNGLKWIINCLLYTSDAADDTPCVEIAHCVREEWEVNNIEKPFEEIKTFIENTPRTEIVEIDGDYLHAELSLIHI